MKTTCPYKHISQKEANKSADIHAPYWSNFSFVSTAEAQSSSNSKSGTISSVGNMQTISSQLSSQLSLPFYLVVLSFFVFAVLMSGVYIYHWTKFNLNDPFIRNYAVVFLCGLFILTMPLIFNLMH